MKDFFTGDSWNWKLGGAILGFVLVLAVFLVKPVGVSTQFVILDGMIANIVSSELIKQDDSKKHGYTSTNAYLDKSGGKYASNVANPLNYSFIFVLAMAFGAFVSARIRVKKPNKSEEIYPKVWTDKFGHSKKKRFAYVFFGGVLMLFGARLAGGCTSGHMMSGMMQTSISGYLFAGAVFAIAVPVAIFFYKKN
jgi:hypothetical protein